MRVQEQKIIKLQAALSKLEDRVVMASDKNISDREYAISEIRYYKGLMDSFLGYPQNLQVDIMVDLSDMIEEVEKWLNE